MTKPKPKRGRATQSFPKAVVNLYEAKTHLSELVERAAAGEEITIAKAGTPRARLVPLPTEPRRAGALKGKVWIARDFDAPLPPELLRQFGVEEADPDEP